MCCITFIQQVRSSYVFSVKLTKLYSATNNFTKDTYMCYEQVTCYIFGIKNICVFTCHCSSHICARQTFNFEDFNDVIHNLLKFHVCASSLVAAFRKKKKCVVIPIKIYRKHSTWTNGCLHVYLHIWLAEATEPSSALLHIFWAFLFST